MAAQQTEALTDEQIKEALAAFSMKKLKFTYWIGTRDNIIYGGDGEFRYGFKIPPSESEEISIPGMEMEFDMEMDMVYSEINKSQTITAPKVSEPVDSPMPGDDIRQGG